MGFTSGFTSGVTLTLGIAYLTVLTHERNRRAQAASLQTQSRLLTSILEPPPPTPPRALSREERISLIEAAKDRWNEEVESAVRRVQSTNWTEVREGLEGALARLLGKGLEKGREGVEIAEEKGGSLVREAVERGKEVAERGKDGLAEGIDRAAAATVAGVERAGVQAKEGAHRITESVRAKSKEAFASAKEEAGRAGVKAGDVKDATTARADRTATNVKTGAQDAAESIRHSGGTVDAARGAVRDAVSRGIEKGKNAVGRAKAAVGLAEERMESRGQAKVMSHSTGVEKALHERYEKVSNTDKSVEEALAERYKPIDQKEDTTPEKPVKIV